MSFDPRFVDPTHHQRPASFHSARVFFPWGTSPIGAATACSILFIPLFFVVLWPASGFLSPQHAVVLAIFSGAVLAQVARQMIDRFRIRSAGNDGIAILLSTHEGTRLLWEAERLCERRERFQHGSADDAARTPVAWQALLTDEHRVERRQHEIIWSGVASGRRTRR
ncbi:MAG: hypothetical protein WC654_01630 [Patescibacteria group bacterium]